MPRKRLRKSVDSSVTLQDVARHAAVSTATVSRFLARPELVREKRRKRIEAAIADLEYIPHGAAQALASQKSRAIGAIVPTLDNAIFATGIHAFQKHLQNVGYTLLVASSDYSLKEECRQGETLIARGIDGMMLIGCDHDLQLYARLQQKKTPYVNTWVYDEASPHPCVGFDNFRAAVRQASYLVDIGHKRFGIIAGLTKDNDRARDRLKGVRHALLERGIAIDEEMIYESPYEISESRQLTRRLLALERPPTGIICGNDVLAYGAIVECQSCSLRVPEDISVVGFDDLSMSQHIRPALTTIHVPSEEMGRKAADYLIARLHGEAVPIHTELEANLILRGSTAPPKRS